MFQEHFGRNRITDHNYLLQVLVYIHMNPIKHGFCTDFANYQHSSYKALISKGTTNLCRNQVIDWFDDQENFVYWHNWNKIKYEGVMKEIEEYDID